MKILSGALFAGLLLVSCGKEATVSAPAPELKKEAAVAPKSPPAPAPTPEKKMTPVPQGELPKMDPEKAKFIAVPSTPKDEEVKKPADAAKK